jgi:N utilization substance protein B
MAGVRRKARVLALQALFEVDCTGHDPEAALGSLVEEKPLPPEATSFAQELVRGVLANRERLDALIQTHAPAWPLVQMPAIDRNILRLALFELLIDNRVPPRVAINEAVELAKSFGSDSSAKFVNGVLGAVSAAHR